MDITTAAAVVFAVVTAGVIAFQIALALGAPWGAYAMGGTFTGRYPPAMRVAALGQAVLLVLIAVVVLSKAGLILVSVSQTLPWLIWIAVAFSGVAVVLNAFTPSARERQVWLPVTMLMLGCSLAVALTAA